MPVFLFVLLVLNFQFFHCGYHNKNCGNKCYSVGNGGGVKNPGNPKKFWQGDNQGNIYDKFTHKG